MKGSHFLLNLTHRTIWQYFHLITIKPSFIDSPSLKSVAVITPSFIVRIKQKEYPKWKVPDDPCTCPTKHRSPHAPQQRQKIKKRPRPATKKPTKTKGIACTAVGKTAKAARGGQPQCGKTSQFCLDQRQGDKDCAEKFSRLMTKDLPPLVSVKQNVPFFF